MCNKLLLIYLFTRGNSDANDMLWMMIDDDDDDDGHKFPVGSGLKI